MLEQRRALWRSLLTSHRRRGDTEDERESHGCEVCCGSETPHGAVVASLPRNLPYVALWWLRALCCAAVASCPMLHGGGSLPDAARRWLFRSTPRPAWAWACSETVRVCLSAGTAAGPVAFCSMLRGATAALASCPMATQLDYPIGLPNGHADCGPSGECSSSGCYFDCHSDDVILTQAGRQVLRPQTARGPGLRRRVRVLLSE